MVSFWQIGGEAFCFPFGFFLGISLLTTMGGGEALGRFEEEGIGFDIERGRGGNQDTVVDDKELDAAAVVVVVVRTVVVT